MHRRLVVATHIMPRNKNINSIIQPLHVIQAMGSKVGTSSATCTMYAKGIDMHVDNLASLAAETN